MWRNKRKKNPQSKERREKKKRAPMDVGFGGEVVWYRANRFESIT